MKTTEKSTERLAILQKIEEYEKNGFFDRDVENDPPTIPLKPGQVDYTGRKFATRAKTRFANRVAHAFFEKQIRKGALVIKEVRGIENFLAVKESGAMLTCNHFNAFDNYAVFKAIEKELKPHDLYKVIREGNYTSFPGLYGFFFRHCNTLPLAKDLHAYKEFREGVDELLKRGEKILIYPEQGMWWNYRKPRPLKLGAFQLACRAGIPVLPFFITMEDGANTDENGFPVQAYTVHILPAITPEKDVTERENARRMCVENYEKWKSVYEDFYGEKLVYTTDSEVKPCSI